MQTLTKLALIGAFSIGMSTSAFAQDDLSVDTVLASVNGVDITVGHLVVARSNLPEQYQSLPPETLYNGLLDQMIQQALLAETITEAPIFVDLLVENTRRTAIATEALNSKLTAAITDDVVQSLYNERYANAEPESEYNASHILVETKEEADSVQAMANGGKDFAELAMELSTGPSGPNGGQLGWFGKGMMVPPFEQAVIAMEVGAISDPVETQFGWHVIKLNDVRDIPIPTIEAVAEELVGELERQETNRILDGLFDGAHITRAEDIDPNIILNLELIGK